MTTSSFAFSFTLLMLCLWGCQSSTKDEVWEAGNVRIEFNNAAGTSSAWFYDTDTLGVSMVYTRAKCDSLFRTADKIRFFLYEFTVSSDPTFKDKSQELSHKESSSLPFWVGFGKFEGEKLSLEMTRGLAHGSSSHFQLKKKQ